MEPHGFRVGDWKVQPDLDRLERDGHAIRLRPKSMAVLVELAGRPGAVVSREDLQRRVWADVHVSEENLSHCIAEIRGALGDDAKQPAYVETVARHGYRLIAPVVRQTAPDGFDAGAAPPPVHGGRAWWTVPRAVIAGGVALAAVALTVSGHTERRPAAAGALVVVMADWENRTGDPVFDRTLRQGLGVALAESGAIRVVPDDRMSHALRLMRAPPETLVVGDVARQVCRRLGADLVAAGEVANLGPQFIVVVELTGCASATPLARVQERAEGREGVLSALDRASAAIRGRLGAMPAGERSTTRSIDEVTTSNLEALRAFTLANDALADRRTAEAIALFGHALELDPDFALAHSRLGSTLAALREWTRANEHRRRAVELAKGLTGRERLYVQAAYDLGTGRVASAEATLSAWARLHPDDRVPLNWLAISHLNRGERAEALAWALAAVKADPAPDTVRTLASVYLNAGRIADAKALVAGLDDPGLQYLVAFLDGDAAEMARQREAVAAGSVDELDMRAREAQAAMAGGRVREARELVGRAEALGLKLGLLELTAQVLATHAVWEAEVGDHALAVDMARAALSMADNGTTRALAVLAFSAAGSTARARDMLARIKGLPPATDPVVSAGSLRKLQAATALAEHRPAHALEALASLRPYEGGGVVSHVALRGDLAELGVHHLRGIALLALGRGEAAATEFQAILDQRGVSPLSPYAAMAPLNLGRAHARAGDARAAMAAYEVFLKRWAGADRDARLLAEARLEYERLGRANAGSR